MRAVWAVEQKRILDNVVKEYEQLMGVKERISTETACYICTYGTLRG